MEIQQNNENLDKSPHFKVEQSYFVDVEYHSQSFMLMKTGFKILREILLNENKIKVLDDEELEVWRKTCPKIFHEFPKVKYPKGATKEEIERLTDLTRNYSNVQFYDIPEINEKRQMMIQDAKMLLGHLNQARTQIELRIMRETALQVVSPKPEETLKRPRGRPRKHPLK